MDWCKICQLIGVLLFILVCYIFYDYLEESSQRSSDTFESIRHKFPESDLQVHHQIFVFPNEIKNDDKTDDKTNFTNSLFFYKSGKINHSISKDFIKSTTEINLFSEIKPTNDVTSTNSEKDVLYNKIVPRKGVDNIEINQNLSVNICFQKTEKLCYSAQDFEDVKCNCCKNSNEVGELIQQQPMNCSSCSEVVLVVPKGTESFCLNICCNKKLSFKTTYEISSTEAILFKNLSSVSSNLLVTDSNKKDESCTTKSETSEKIINLENKNVLQNFTKKIIQKPSITKVPYDVEVMTEILKAKKEVFLPVVVSIFLLPLLGVLLFFIWKRIKYSWNKRYYKKVDYLLEGMYNE